MLDHFYMVRHDYTKGKGRSRNINIIRIVLTAPFNEICWQTYRLIFTSKNSRAVTAFANIVDYFRKVIIADAETVGHIESFGMIFCDSAVALA